MEIHNFSTFPLENPKYVFPVAINYTQNSVEKKWEAVRSHDSVAVLLYHKEKNAFLLVKQFRPAVYLNNQSHGITYELCAGILDKEIELLQTVREEIDEECGFNVLTDQIQKITSFYTSVGVAGAHQTIYYAEIDESMKIHDGGGINDEEIELFYLPVIEAKKFALDENIPKTPGLMFAFYWFFDVKGINYFS